MTQILTKNILKVNNQELILVYSNNGILAKMNELELPIWTTLTTVIMNETSMTQKNTYNMMSLT